MKKLYSKGKFILLFVTTGVLFCACGKSDKEEKNPYQKYVYNDYRGSLTRADKVRTDVIAVIDRYKELNTKSVGNTMDFWKSDNYAYISNELLDETTVSNTWYLNESVSTWEEAQVATTENFITESGRAEKISVIRNSVNNYTISYKDVFKPVWNKNSTELRREIHCVYDANHDWMQALIETSYEKFTINDGIFEYGRNDNTFIIQTETERLVVTYEDVVDADSMAIGQKITGFKYSRLSGEPLSKFHVIKEEEEQANQFSDYTDDSRLVNVSEDGVITTQYTLDDSIFTHMTDIDEDWVTEAGTYNEVIEYDGKTLILKISNPLSQKLETITFYEDGKASMEEEALFNEKNKQEDVSETAAENSPEVDTKG